MRVLANIITNLFELAGMLFLLAVVTSILLGVDLMGPTLNWINNNVGTVAGLGFVYLLYKSESDI